MITLKQETADLIRKEMESIPEKYQKPFNSPHEGLGVLREEYIELENEIFFGEKKAKDHPYTKEPGAIAADLIWKEKIRREAVQVAAMACRIIQEIT